MIQPFAEPVYVTRPYLPPLADYTRGLQGIWERRWLTNHGPIHRQFEAALAHRLGTPQVSLMANGTLALQIALQGLGVTGEVITTPFTFAATTHALRQQQLQPIFVDIEPETYTLDPVEVEAAITPATTAILGVHVYGCLLYTSDAADDM
jgi:dTDP-4-amino-4,6-dideoxygalactose transaminase